MHNKYSRKTDKPSDRKFSNVSPESPVITNFLPATPRGFSRRLHRKQAADYLGVSLSWLDKARISGLGPIFITIGGRILYDSRDLEVFIDSNRRSSTSEEY